MTTQNKDFYKNGIRFECQESGKCCRFRGGYGYVYLSLADRRRLSTHFGLPTRVFTIKHTEKTEGLFHLKRVTKNCLFLKENRCSVYKARPVQCRTWPFWPDNMKQTVWEKEVKSYCPGVGKGKLYPAEEIDKILKEHKKTCGER